jgi:Tfp pilus assembly protein FimT
MAVKDDSLGFSLTECLVICAIFMIIASVGVVQLRSTITIVDADRAVNLVASQLTYAREIAVDQRRNVQVEFIGSNEIRITRHDGGGETTVVSDVSLPPGFTYSLPFDAGDTPDGYGNETPVYFNAATSGTFLGDGSFVNDDGVVMSGSIFTMNGSDITARALTLTGASGRVRTYRFEGIQWAERI